MAKAAPTQTTILDATEAAFPDQKPTAPATAEQAGQADPRKDASGKAIGDVLSRTIFTGDNLNVLRGLNSDTLAVSAGGADCCERDGGMMERSPGLDAEWDRNRVEEEPELWDLAIQDKARRELPLEVEPCLETLRGAGGQVLGLACQPVWRKGKFWCGLCDRDVLIMRKVPVPLPDVIEADKETEPETKTKTGVVNMRSRMQWKEKWGG